MDDDDDDDAGGVGGIGCWRARIEGLVWPCTDMTQRDEGAFWVVYN